MALATNVHNWMVLNRRSASFYDLAARSRVPDAPCVLDLESASPCDQFGATIYALLPVRLDHHRLEGA